jgi:hypothetical protein
MNLRRPTMDMAQIVRWWPEAERVLALRERPAIGSEETYAYLARETEKAFPVVGGSPWGFV